MGNHIIFFSGGISSFAAAEYVKRTFPDENIVLYFTDTCWESEDLYRFIHEASDKLELPLLSHSTGLNPIQLMFEKKLVFNNMIGDCSKILKMRTASDFLKRGIGPRIEEWRNKHFLKANDFITDATLYFGIGFEEMHRVASIASNWSPFSVNMPLIDHNIYRDETLAKYDIRKPVLYELGFSHNNCNGRCVKAGQGHYKLLRERMPDVFQKLMEQEHYLKICVSAYRYITKGNKRGDVIDPQDIIPLELQEVMLQELDDAFRDYFYDRAAKPKLYIHPASSASCEFMSIHQYSFMKRTGKNKLISRTTLPNGTVQETVSFPSEPYPLRDLHYDILQDGQMDLFDIGGCSCFLE